METYRPTYLYHVDQRGLYFLSFVCPGAEQQVLSLVAYGSVDLTTAVFYQ